MITDRAHTLPSSMCPEIGKESFRIFDAVDLYPHLQDLTEMKPVAADPGFTLTRLFDELAGRGDAAHKNRVREQIIVRLRRRLKHLTAEARAQFEKAAGETPEASLHRFMTGDAVDLSSWAAARPGIGPILDWTNADGTPRYVPISEHDDEVTSVTRGYGEGATRPEDSRGKRSPGATTISTLAGCVTTKRSLRKG